MKSNKSRKRKVESSLVCVVHYPDQSSYSNIKDLSDVNKIKIVEAKRVRRELGGPYSHSVQCDAIPEQFQHGIHGIHLEPCYKR